MNKKLLSTFGSLPNLIEESICKDIENIKNFLSKKHKVIIPPDDCREWYLEANEVGHLRVLLKTLKEFDKSNIPLHVFKGNDRYYDFVTYDKRISEHLFREIVRNFATETIKVLISNGIRVECRVGDDDNLIVETP